MMVLLCKYQSMETGLWSQYQKVICTSMDGLFMLGLYDCLKDVMRGSKSS